MPQMSRKLSPIQLLALCIALVLGAYDASAQTGRRPERVAAPDFSSSQFDSVFFEDAKSMLRGELPTSRVVVQQSGQNQASDRGSEPAEDSFLSWKNLIAPDSLEDLIKGSKLRLDKVVTTQPAFVGGGYAESRKEFSLLAVLFAIVENHPKDVRWKSSSAAARELLVRVAANTKIGTQQVYNEAKLRMLDLGDLMRGSPLSYKSKMDVDWSNLIDRVPLMQLLEWAHTEHVSTYSASETAFSKDKESLRRYAELIAVLGRIAIAEEMPDGSDEDYQAFAIEMIKAAQQISIAVKTDNAKLARQASGMIGQSCSNCHDDFM